MRTYVGTLTASVTIKEETCSISFNGGLRTGATAVLVTSWTNDQYGKPNRGPFVLFGTITELEDGKISIFGDKSNYYWWQGTVSENGNKLTLEMWAARTGRYGGPIEYRLEFDDDSI
ncbi:hypothetical protein BDV24DRAFT_163078 [Aspergillus arachidicola]|uniref:Uncharacterized protein n=1 Tax=Aspergillus arachidicola TaxID=656916 RepID=A0A5N6Y8U0_9EURO|nr:hypothetical protein BDV24DRAFT_163078 [Aspergillus arachidicola]